MKKKILFVCHGNICRSPMAEFVLKNLDETGAFDIASAAVSTEETGNDIYPPAQRKIQEKGIPFTHRAARQMTKADYDYYDFIVCMDRSNLRWMRYILGFEPEVDAGAPERHKVSLMMHWAGEDRDVADPWYTGDFERAYKDIEKGCKGLLNKIMTAF